MELMLISSLIKAQQEFTEVKKSKKSNFGEYSTTQDILEATQPALGKYGLKLRSGIHILPSGQESIFVELEHQTSGEVKRSSCLMRDGVIADKDWGAAFTFRTRHMYKNMLGLVTSDYDDNDEGEQIQRSPSSYSRPVPVNLTKINIDQLNQLSNLSADSQVKIRTFNNVAHLKELTKSQYDSIVKSFRLTPLE